MFLQTTFSIATFRAIDFANSMEHPAAHALGKTTPDHFRELPAFAQHGWFVRPVALLTTRNDHARFDPNRSFQSMS
jgi:hypothetical protein